MAGTGPAMTGHARYDGNSEMRFHYDGDCFASLAMTADDHRIFNVARPTRARIIEMIQKRITMVGSDQPFFSK